MKKRQKIVVLILALVICVSLALPAAASDYRGAAYQNIFATLGIINPNLASPGKIIRVHDESAAVVPANTEAKAEKYELLAIGTEQYAALSGTKVRTITIYFGAKTDLSSVNLKPADFKLEWAYKDTGRFWQLSEGVTKVTVDNAKKTIALQVDPFYLKSTGNVRFGPWDAEDVKTFSVTCNAAVDAELKDILSFGLDDLTDIYVGDKYCSFPEAKGFSYVTDPEDTENPLYAIYQPKNDDGSKMKNLPLLVYLCNDKGNIIVNCLIAKDFEPVALEKVKQEFADDYEGAFNLVYYSEADCSYEGETEYPFYSDEVLQEVLAKQKTGELPTTTVSRELLDAFNKQLSHTMAIVMVHRYTPTLDLVFSISKDK